MTEGTTRSINDVNHKTKEERMQKNPLKPEKKEKEKEKSLSFCYYPFIPYISIHPSIVIPMILIRFVSTQELEQPLPCSVSSKGSQMYKSIPTSSLG